MYRFTRNLVVAAAGAISLTAASTSIALAISPGGQDSPQSLRVDSRSVLSTPSPHDLRSGSYYLATISGVVSFYSQPVWSTPKAGRVICGSTAPITTPSSSQTAGVGGADAEMLFAGAAKRGCGVPKPPYQWGNFKVSTNGWTYSNMTPIAGPRTTPTSDHTYTYALAGHGTEARFKFDDVRYSDNNGSVLVQIRRASGSDCKNNGWTNFGSFKNEKDCTLHI